MIISLIVLIVICVFVGIIEAQEFCINLLAKVDRPTQIWGFIFIFIGATICAPFLIFESLYKKYIKKDKKPNE